MPGLIYAQARDTVYVNLYAGSEATIAPGTRELKLTWETDYPRNGKVRLTVDPAQAATFTLKLRIPGWARDEVLPGGPFTSANKLDARPSFRIDGQAVEVAPADGYLTLTRGWKPGAVVELDFPMQVREVTANAEVAEDRGKLSLEYGPLVYAVEEVDNPTSYDAIAVSPTDQFAVCYRAGLLGGVNVIEGKRLTAIPYYAWSNRGIGKMRVWLPTAASR